MPAVHTSCSSFKAFLADLRVRNAGLSKEAVDVSLLHFFIGESSSFTLIEFGHLNGDGVYGVDSFNIRLIEGDVKLSSLPTAAFGDFGVD